MGLGFVLRDHWGSVVLTGKSMIRAEGRNTILEEMVIRYALKTVGQYRQSATHVEFNKYTLVRVQLINAPK